MFVHQLVLFVWYLQKEQIRRQDNLLFFFHFLQLFLGLSNPHNLVGFELLNNLLYSFWTWIFSVCCTRLISYIFANIYIHLCQPHQLQCNTSAESATVWIYLFEYTYLCKLCYTYLVKTVFFIMKNLYVSDISNQELILT